MLCDLKSDFGKKKVVSHKTSRIFYYSSLFFYVLRTYHLNTCNRIQRYQIKPAMDTTCYAVTQVSRSHRPRSSSTILLFSDVVVQNVHLPTIYLNAPNLVFPGFDAGRFTSSICIIAGAFCTTKIGLRAVDAIDRALQRWFGPPQWNPQRWLHAQPASSVCHVRPGYHEAYYRSTSMLKWRTDLPLPKPEDINRRFYLQYIESCQRMLFNCCYLLG